MSTALITLAAGTAKPTGFAQMGDRLIVCYEDLRPLVIMPDADGTMTAYEAGIKAPKTAPTVAATATAATYNTNTGSIYVVYAYWSSHRRVMSQISPEATITGTSYQLLINGFEAPRDNYATQDIDAILVGVQLGLAPGHMCLFPVMRVDCSAGDFTSQSYTFDLSQLDLLPGLNLTQASLYCEVPPAFQYCDVFKEHVFYAGQRRTVSFASTTATVANATYRGKDVSSVTLAGSGTFTDGHLGMALYLDGVMSGFLWDRTSGTVGYLDRRITAGSKSTVEARGIRDRIWPSGYHNASPGNIPIVSPETICSFNSFAVPRTADQEQVIKGVKKGLSGLVVALERSIVSVTGCDKPNVVDPAFQEISAPLGTVAPKSVATTQDGRLAWMGIDGPIIEVEAGIRDLANEQGCLRLFNGEEWITKASLAGCVMAHVPEFGGFIVGNLTVNGTGNYWLLYSEKPQKGFWLMSGQEMTSNILSYPDDNGSSVLLVGDGYQARVKRLFTPSTLVDVGAATDSTDGYTCLYRGGWVDNQSGKKKSAQYLRIPGLILPGASVAMDLIMWCQDYPLRHDTDLTADNIETISLTQNDLAKRIPLRVGHFRFHSAAFSWDSESGQSADKRPIELVRWVLESSDG